MAKSRACQTLLSQGTMNSNEVSCGNSENRTDTREHDCLASSPPCRSPMIPESPNGNPPIFFIPVVDLSRQRLYDGPEVTECELQTGRAGPGKVGRDSQCP